MLTIILLSIAGAIVAAIIGTFWYSDKTPMGRIHMKYLGFDKLSPEEQKRKIEEMKPIMWKYYSLQLILSILTSFATVFIIITSIKSDLPFSVGLGFVLINWLCFVVPTVGSAILWSNCDRNIAWQKFFSDIFSILVTIVVIAILASWFV